MHVPQHAPLGAQHRGEVGLLLVGEGGTAVREAGVASLATALVSETMKAKAPQPNAIWITECTNPRFAADGI